MIRVVLDTNILVAAVISPTGPNAQLLECIVGKKIRPYVTSTVFQEYEAVFQYERLKHLDKRRVAKVLRQLKACALQVKSRGRLKLSEHEEDNRIYECALAAKADYIVTENAKHFKQSHRYTRIITARQLLKLMDPAMPTS